MKNKSYYFLVIILALAGIFLVIPKVSAEEATRIKIDRDTISKGYTVEHDEKNIRFAVTPYQVDQEVNVTIKNDSIQDDALPAGKIAVSDFYTFDMLGNEYNPIIVQKPSWLAMHYYSENPNANKSIYYWDGNKNSWLRLPSQVNQTAQEVRAITHLPYSRIVVLEDTNCYQGIASWFGSSRKMVAASRDFPLNTKLRVKNLDNNKSVEVTVVSNGPFIPERIIDLSTDAFSAIANRSEGLARVEVRPVEISITSPAGIVINTNTGEMLWEQNQSEIRSIASLTKIMTALVFLDTKIPFSQVVTIESSDSAEGAKLYVNPGETLTVRDLFFATLVGSANNASKALARSTGLSTEEFVSRMNAKAEALGMTNTHFIEPSGLNPDNKSTVADYAILAREALKSFTMLQGTTTREYTFTTINTGVFHSIKNTNELLTTDLYITGGKTGYLDEAGYCLMTQARDSDNNQIIAIILGASSSKIRFEETEKLLRWGLDYL